MIVAGDRIRIENPEPEITGSPPRTSRFLLRFSRDLDRAYRTASVNTWLLARNVLTMWPWGHAAIGYLLYKAYTQFRYSRPPNDASTALLLLGTQFPDLIDKPLAWTLALLPSGRSLGHSLLVLIPLSILVYMLAARYRHAEWGSAFAIGALSHAVVDVLPSAIRGEYAYTTSLLWPLLPVPPSDELNRTILGHFFSIEPMSMLALETILVIVMLIIWWHDGRPGGTLIQNAPKLRQLK